MVEEPITIEGLEIHPVNVARWPDVEQLFTDGVPRDRVCH